jgi:hypothetical protein
MLSTLLFSAKLLFGVFTASTASAYLLCFYNDVPFFNPSYNRYRTINRIEKLVKISMRMLGNFSMIYAIVLNRKIDLCPHSVDKTIYNVAAYSMIAEFVYYLYHRMMHMQQEVYPCDTFYVTEIDGLLLLGTLSSPILFLDLTHYEFAFCLYFYLTATYISHSSTNHSIHHKLLFYNFFLLNPIYDILSRTYRQ